MLRQTNNNCDSLLSAPSRTTGSWRLVDSNGFIFPVCFSTAPDADEFLRIHSRTGSYENVTVLDLSRIPTIESLSECNNSILLKASRDRAIKRKRTRNAWLQTGLLKVRRSHPYSFNHWVSTVNGKIYTETREGRLACICRF